MSEVEERNYTQERLQSVERPLESQLPAVPAQPQHHGGSGRGITFAVLLIGLGAALLLSNLGIITLSWAVLLNFWPVVLILIGLDVLLGGRSAAGSAFVALVSLCIVGGTLWWASQMPAPVGGTLVKHPIEFSLNGAEALDVNLKLGAGNTTIDSVNDPQVAAHGTFETNEDASFDSSYSNENGHGFMTFSHGNGIMSPDDLVGNLELFLTNAVPINLIIEAGLGDLNLHLTDLLLESLDINGGAGNVELELPDHGGYTVDMDAGLGNVEVSVPDDMEAQISVDTGLGNFEIDDRFEEVSEGVWQTEGYQEGAANTIDMTIDAGAGNVEIND